MQQCHKLWILRNNERHGVTPAEKATALRTTAERELVALYDQRDECEHRHRRLFFPTLGDHNRQTLPERRNWISMHSSIIRISCERNQAARLIPPDITWTQPNEVARQRYQGEATTPRGAILASLNGSSGPNK
jgi:hypothetical protein